MYQWLQRLFSGPSTEAATPPPPEAAAPPPAARPPAAAPKSGSGIPFDQADTVERSYNAWLFGVDNAAELDLNPAEQQVLDAMAEVLSNQQSGAALVRRMPGLIPQLLQSLRSENFSGAALSRTISSDLVLVAAVIRLANNSMKGSGQSISSVEHAVMVIGQEGLRHIITSVAFKPIIDMNSGYYSRNMALRIWEHSERCANANRALAASMEVDPFEAFLAGLVQNVGLIATLRIMDQAPREEHALGSEMFCAYLMRDARILANSIAREWNFPESVIKALAEQGAMAKGASMSPLGRLTALSTYLGKVRILSEQGRVRDQDPFLLGGLPANAAACYAELGKVDEEAPA